MAVGSTQLLTEISTKNLSEGKGRPARKTETSPPSVNRVSRENVEASTSHNTIGLHGMLQG
jgi:hypothetical protein